MSCLFSRCCLGLVLLLSLASPLYPANFPADPSSSTQKDAIAPVPAMHGLLEQSSQLSREEYQLHSSPAMTFDTGEVQDQLGRIQERIGSLNLDLSQIKNGQKDLDERVFILKSSLKNEYALVERQVDPVLQMLDVLQRKKQYWMERQSEWDNWYTQVLKENSAASLRDVMRSTIETIENASESIIQKSNELIQTARRATDIQSEIFQMEQKVERRIDKSSTIFPNGNISPLFTPRYLKQLHANGWTGLVKGIEENARPDWQLLQNNAKFIFLQLLTAALIALFLLYIRNEKTLESLEFVGRPISAGIFASLLFLRPFEPVSPPVWMFVETVLTWIAFIRLYMLYTDKRSYKALMVGLAVIHILLQLFWLVKVPFVITRLIIFLTSVGASAALFIVAVRYTGSRWVRFCIKLLAVLFGVIALMELIGFTDMSKTLYRTSVNTLSVFAKAWLFFQIAMEGVDWLLESTSSKGRYLSEESLPLVSKLSRMVIYLFFIICVAIYLLVGWGVFESSNEAFKNILSLGVALGNIQLSVSDFLQAVFLAALTLFASVAIQSALIENIFPSMGVPKEVGFSISRLIHYCVLAVGVLLVLLSLGVSFTNLAIFGGALGVGLGLGLQEIVKNFAAGIIILVERPIKIGDLVEFENTTCRVEKIGLRSTLVRSLDGIFKVIPNNDLIVNPVTNWTHSRKRLRKSSMIGVAYGSDVNLTMRLLKEAAEEHESVLKHPEPEVYFEEFGDSSLNFELRYWVKDVSLIKIVPSEINQTIERKLFDVGIEIPFPQMDVHFFDEAKNTP